MLSLKQLRTRIHTIKSIQKITKAMHIVSAAKLRRIKGNIDNIFEFPLNTKKIISNLINHYHLFELSDEQKYFLNQEYTKTNVTLIILITSERGLCGNFNSSVIKKMKYDIESKYKNKEIKLIIIGKKGYDALKNLHANQIIDYYQTEKDKINLTSYQLSRKIIELITKREIGNCQIYYNQFKNVMSQVVIREQILPIDISDDDYAECKYEGENIIDQSIHLYLIGSLSFALNESKISEEAARMTAMDSATRNASQLIDNLNLILNRSSLAAISSEFNEIISGAEAT